MASRGLAADAAQAAVAQEVGPTAPVSPEAESSEEETPILCPLTGDDASRYPSA